MREQPWIAVDLDATLAHYGGWKGVQHIGSPIKPMCDKVKQWLREGKRVKIFTARLHNNGDRNKVTAPIKRWCKANLGQELEVTNVKTQGMIELWDDRAFNVPKNGKFDAGTLLAQGAVTYAERNKLYKDNYKAFGKLLLALFPNGTLPAITKVEDASRLNLILDCLCKLQRYAYNFETGGHKDSAHDLMVYAAMLEESTE